MRVFVSFVSNVLWSRSGNEATLRRFSVADDGPAVAAAFVPKAILMTGLLAMAFQVNRVQIKS